MDYLNKYANKGVSKFQAGGPMPAEGGAPAPEAAPQGGAPDLEAMLAEWAQTQDPNLAMQICAMLVEMMGGGGAPAPAMRGGGRMAAKKAPMFSKGGIIKG